MDQRELRGRTAPNSKWRHGITYRGSLYGGPAAIYASANPKPNISSQAFSLRISTRAGDLTDVNIDECLYLPVAEYKAKYATRLTKIYLDGGQISLSDLYAKMASPKVTYRTFWQRVRRLSSLNQLSTERGQFAANASQRDWLTEYGGGRRIPFTYDAQEFPDLVGQSFPSVAAFLKKIGRYEDRSLIRRRLSAQWSIDAALSEPAVPETARCYRIYRISRLADGRSYVGLTILDAASRFAQHIRKAKQGSALPLHQALRAEGSDGFVLEVLEDGLSADIVGIREKHWIDFLGSLQPNGFNVAVGGQLGGGSGKPIDFNGEKFHSIEEAAAVLSKRTNLAKHVVIKRLAAGMPLPEKARKHSEHPAAGSRPYRRWLSMINSVEKKNGGTLDPSWRSYDQYVADVGSKPPDKDRLVRVDPKGAWGPGNFEWVTNQVWIERQNGIGVTLNGVTYPSLIAVARAFGIGYSTLKDRLSVQRMTLEQAVGSPTGATSRKGKPPIMVDGEAFKSLTDAARQISERTGEHPEKIRYRLRRDIKVHTA